MYPRSHVRKPTKQLFTVLTVMAALVSPSSSQGNEDENVLENVRCTNDSECNLDHYKSFCLDTGQSKLCSCDTQSGFFKVNDSCVYKSKVDEFCIEGSTVCRDPSAVCQSTFDIQGLTRCQCMEGTYKIYQEGEPLCVERLMPEVAPTCKPCITNHGFCYDVDKDQEPDGCQCPSAFSGEICQKAHVNVTCSVKYMDVCYEPHPGFNFSASSWLHVDGHGDVGACRAWRDDARCGPGNYWLQLQLSDDHLDMCGTKRLYTEHDGKLTYSNQLVVQKDGYQSTNYDIYFTTFCSFTRTHTVSFGYNIDSRVGSDIGHEVLPFIVLTVKNTLQRTIAENTYIRPGDHVFYNIYLKPSNGYSAIRVEYCTISNSGKIPDYEADSQLVIDQGCPAKNQNFINNVNNWKRYLGKPHELQTGIVQVEPLDNNPLFFLHCTLKLCVNGYEEGCEPVNCTESSRKRRSVETEDMARFASVQTQISFRMPDPEESSVLGTTNLQTIIIICIVALVSVVTALCILTIYSLRSKGYSDTENRPNRVLLFNSSSYWYKLFYNDDFPSYMTESKV